MAIYWPTQGFKGRTFKLCVLTRWDFNFYVRRSPPRESKREVTREQARVYCGFSGKIPPHSSNSIYNIGFYPQFRHRSGELRTQKLKSHLVRTQSLNVLPLKPWVGQYIAIHATLTARNFFLTYFYPSGRFTCIFSKTSPNFFLCWLWLTLVPV